MAFRPSLRQLEYAVAVAEHGQFGRAASACFVSQPALSTAIAQLEAGLGAQLFERTPRGVLVTPAGREVTGRARAVLRAVDDLVAAAATGHPLTGDVRLGVIPTISPYVLPALLPSVRAAFPELRLLLREEQTARLLAGLRGGTLDAALLALPLEDDGGLTGADLFEEPFVVAAPEGHALVERAGAGGLAPTDLCDQEVLLLEEGHCLRDQALDVCRAIGARGSEQVQATSLTTLVQMVANGLGVTILPATAVAVEVPPGGGVVVRPFADPPPVRRVGLVWRASSGRADELAQLGAFLREQAEVRLGQTGALVR